MDRPPTLQAPSPSPRRERQLIAGKYRLAAFHRGDSSTEVWRALDESRTQVVTLEFLLDRDAMSRERFLSAARRMAAVERPAVMKVGEINEDPECTFVVYEHLVHVPVPLDWLKPVNEPQAAPLPAMPAAPSAPATMAAPAAPKPPVAPQVAQPPPVQQFTPAPPPPMMQVAPMPPPMAADPLPVEAKGAEAPAPEAGADAETEEHDHRHLESLISAMTSGELSLIDGALLRASASELWDVICTTIDNTRVEDVEELVRGIPGLVGVASVLGSVVGIVARPLTMRPRIRMPVPHLPSRAPKGPKVATERPVEVKVAKVKVAKVKPVKMPKVAAMPKAPRAPRAPLRMPRVRWGRVLVGGLIPGILGAVVLIVPPETLLTIGAHLRDRGIEVAVTVRDKGLETAADIQQRIQQSQGSPGLAKANFEVPPLSEYGATFEAQAPYPTVRPEGNVEWVVALRNTGSAGWYRGIDGAQASLVSADGAIKAVQSTEYVGPGQIGWFVVKYKAPAQPGTHRIPLLPRIDGRGPLPDLGIQATVTVSAP